MQRIEQNVGLGKYREIIKFNYDNYENEKSNLCLYTIGN